MKKILSTLLLALAFVSANAQKEYVICHAQYSEFSYNYKIVLEGNVPSDIKEKYDYGLSGLRLKSYAYAECLAALSKAGYIIEQYSVYKYKDDEERIHILFSKQASAPSNAIERIANDNSEVKEIARYNLQGLPVRASEKGIQIIVYSNYTTKTVVKL